MSSDKRRQLQEQYKNMKPEMGVFIIRCNSNGKFFAKSNKNMKSKINSITFQLNANSHPNSKLQKDWNEHGESNFTIEVLEVLEYDKDECKTDYKEELDMLESIWIEKLGIESSY